MALACTCLRSSHRSSPCSGTTVNAWPWCWAGQGSSSGLGTNLGLQEEVAVCGLPITPGTAHGLHVALKAWGQTQVQHRPHIRSVQPHPKGHGGNHHS